MDQNVRGKRLQEDELDTAAPVAPPRLSKAHLCPPSATGSDKSKSPTPHEELKGEMDMLRSEISSLKRALTEQIRGFNDERRRWEDEKAKVSWVGFRAVLLIIEDEVEILDFFFANDRKRRL